MVHAKRHSNNGVNSIEGVVKSAGLFPQSECEMKHGADRASACAEEGVLFDMLNQACNGRCAVRTLKPRKYRELSESVAPGVALKVRKASRTSWRSRKLYSIAQRLG